jgi:hypothetical protein
MRLVLIALAVDSAPGRELTRSRLLCSRERRAVGPAPLSIATPIWPVSTRAAAFAPIGMQTFWTPCPCLSIGKGGQMRAARFLAIPANRRSLIPACRLIKQSFLILGWVANWRPLEIFLYDLWSSPIAAIFINGWPRRGSRSGLTMPEYYRDGGPAPPGM